jgi:hypothetical protein
MNWTNTKDQRGHDYAEATECGLQYAVAKQNGAYRAYELHTNRAPRLIAKAKAFNTCKMLCCRALNYEKKRRDAAHRQLEKQTKA